MTTDRRSSRRSARRWSVLLAVLGILLGTSGRDAALARQPPLSITDLFDLVSGARETPSLDEVVLPEPGTLGVDPLAPYSRFLTAELLRRRGDHEQARAMFRGLAEWGASDPFGDGSGGSAIAAGALYRWIELLELEDRPPADEVGAAMDATASIRRTRFARGLSEGGHLESLPGLEEAIERRITRLAYDRLERLEPGEEREQAEDLLLRQFVAYMRVTREQSLEPWAVDLEQRLFQRGLARPDAWAVLRGERLLRLRSFSESRQHLEKAMGSSESWIRAEARLLMSDLPDLKTNERCRERLELLTAVVQEAPEAELRAEALYERALAQKPQARESECRGQEDFIRDLERLVQDHPESPWTARAIHSLATYWEHLAATLHATARGAGAELDRREALWEEAGDALRRCLERYTDLRGFKGENDELESAYYRPAVALYRSPGCGHLERALDFFRGYLERFPSGVFAPRAAFWAARIREELGHTVEARTLFQQVVALEPYGYHGLRARMHLHVGARAKTMLWPDETTLAALREEGRSAILRGRFAITTPHHERLRLVVDSGLYERTVAAHDRTRERLGGTRLQEAEVSRLEEEGVLPQVLLRLATRLDAITCFQGAPDDVERLKVATAIHRSRDQPLVLFLLFDLYDGDHTELARRLQRLGDAYLPLAFPRVYREELHAARGREGVRDVPAELLYAVARRQSAFDPLSRGPTGEFGLFQFTRGTFNGYHVTLGWKLLEGSEVEDFEEYLSDPGRSIDLGARHFHELIARERRRAPEVDEGARLLFAIMEHMTSPRSVEEFIERLRAEDRLQDIEYGLATFDNAGIRIFARSVINAMAMARALEIVPTDAEDIPPPADDPASSGR